MRSHPSAERACGGRLGIVEVVRHDAAAAQEDLARLARRHVVPLPSTMRSSNPGRGRPTVVAMVSTSSPGEVAAAVPPSVSP